MRGPSSVAIGLAILLAVLPPLAAAQLPGTPPALDPVVEQGEQRLSGAREQYVGPELQREDIDVDIRMEFTDLDFDTVNVIFGGGRFLARARVDATIDMRAIAASRIQDAVEGAAPGVGNLTAMGFDPSTSFIPADVFRATFAGEALRAFQDEQEARLAEFIEETIPNVTVLSTSFEWVNVSPQGSLEQGLGIPSTPEPEDAELYDLNDPTEPPLTLRARVDIEYLQRTNLLEILDVALKPKSEAEKARKAQVADAGADYDRSAFGLLGIRQVLDLQAEGGWNVRVTVVVPDGYTIEEASPDVLVGGDLREARVLTLGKDADDKVLNPVSLTLSNRFLVSTALLAIVLLVGGIVRFPVILAVNGWRRRMRK